ncbi:MAG: nitroreductase family protein [Rhodovarius sp.]|nr:nitroreductase family protein [Rhodovarius sp.]
MTSPEELIRARFGSLPFAPPAELPPALAALLDRRVTRRYRPDPVPEPLLSAVLAAAQSAPSKSDLQQYAIIVLQQREKIAAIAGWIGTMPWIADAPVFLLFCADMRRGRRICALHGREFANDSMDGFLNAVVDATAAMAFCIAAADAAGLGSCPISYVRNHLEKVAPLAGLPKGVFPVAGLTLGWPEARNPTSPRLPPAVVVHRERYDDSGLEAALAAYDALRPPAAPRYPDLFGQARERWSANAARQLAVPERAGLRTWLRWHGFGLE